MAFYSAGVLATGIGSLDALYAELPDLDCKQLCARDSGCLGAGLIMSPIEAWRLGRFPVQEGPGCPNLTRKGRCAGHEIRPMICRLWGLTESSRCPHGCEPSRWLTEDEMRDYVRRSAEAGDDG
jgi:Fe-S-cluster containining protein